MRFDSTQFNSVLFVFLTCSKPMGKVRQWQAGSKLVAGVVYLSPHWRGHGDAVSQPGMLTHDHLTCRQTCVCVCVKTACLCLCSVLLRMLSTSPS